MGRLIYVLLLFYFQVSSSLSTLLSSSVNSAPLCLPQESSALLQFKTTLSLGSYSKCDISYPKPDSWNETTNCCLWEGVTCDNITAHVIALDLSCSFLIGSLSANASLFLLQRLQQLNLAHNIFEGSLSSDILSRLVSLTHLNLSNNYFSGSIPSEISLLSKLVSLDLSRNDFTIDKYSYDMLARNLSKLTNLFFDGVNMSCVPPSSLLNFTSSLERLSLGDCQLRGEFPTDVFRFRSLQYLDLSYNYNLTGLLPKSNWSSPLELLDLSYCNFGGPLPASLGNLTQIVSLDLLPNSFEGEIPDVFGSLKSLAGPLWLDSTHFSGPLPSTIFNLTQITQLVLSGNSLEGELPTHVTVLQNLELLLLDKNLISGAAPSWLFALPSLNILDLSHNKLHSLPTDDQIQKPNSVLQEIYLGSNEIHGTMPSFFFDLVNLTYLDLSSNKLSGVITSKMLAKSKSLERLYLSNNSLLSLSSNNDIDFNYSFHELDFSYCNIRRFPSFLRTGKKLTNLDLSNNKIQGSISKWDSEGWEQLIYLNLSYNSLTCLEQYPGKKLGIFDASSNQLHGPLLAPPPSFLKLIIPNNSLTGEIPTLICNLSSLEVLDLSINNLGGIIPACLANFSSLLNIKLQLNNFHGQIPAFGSLALLGLALNDNKLEGLLPRSLVNCWRLHFLNVANNKINDTFPHWLGILPRLQVMVLRANRFHGSLENVIAPSSFSSMRIIDLSQNVFSGTLPTNILQDSIAMKFGQTMGRDRCNGRFCDEDDNNDKSVKVVMKSLLLELQLGRTLPGFTVIDFSNNQFYGRIPNELGELGSLHVLNLSYNQFTGSIPPLLGHMKALESLDLSSNKLGGGIPLELTNLTFLEVLNLSQNNFVGPIPQGKQFNTFESDSYRGNPGLWGCPLSKKCRRIPEPPPPTSIVDQEGDEDDSGIPFILKVAMMGYGCGVVLGLSMGYIIFTTGRPWWIVRKIEGDWQKNANNWIRRIRGRRN